MDAVPILNRVPWRDGRLALEIRKTKAFGPHDLATDTDRHRKARQVLLGDTRTNDLPSLLHGAGPLSHWSRMRNGRHVLFASGCRGRAVRRTYTKSPRMNVSSRPTPTRISARKVLDATPGHVLALLLPRGFGPLSQQAGDLPETLKGQRRLCEMESERALPYRGEARGQNVGDFQVRVDIEDELDGRGALFRNRADQAGHEQCSHIVGTPPRHWAGRVMHGLEVEPVRDSGLEVDQHVLRHGVPVSESQVMELGKGDDRSVDRPLSDRLLQLRILQQGRQRLSSDERQDEHAVGIDPDRRTAEAPIDQALPLLPLPLREDPHAGIQDPEERITHPDQERRVERAKLSHAKVAVLADDLGLRVPRGSEQPP